MLSLISLMLSFKNEATDLSCVAQLKKYEQLKILLLMKVCSKDKINIYSCSGKFSIK